MNNTIKLLLSLFALSIRVTVGADTLIVEGDLDVQGGFSAGKDKNVVAPAVQTDFKVEPNGVIWAGSGEDFDITNLIPTGSGARLIWIPEKAAFRISGITIGNTYGLEFSNIGTNSTAWGTSNIASGDNSTAWGTEASASGDRSTAWGFYTTASGDDSTAWGFDTVTSGGNSTAWGFDTVASGYRSTAWGSYTTASGDNSTAWGINSIASGYDSTTWGQVNTASNFSSTAWGRGNIASGSYSTVWGERNRAKSSHSTVFGRNNLGSFTVSNDGDDNNDGDTVWFDMDPLFEIGIGVIGSNANALTLLKDSRIAFGKHTTLGDLQTQPETVQIQGALKSGDYTIDPGANASEGAIRFGDDGNGADDLLGYVDGAWKSLTSSGSGSGQSNQLTTPDMSTVAVTVNSVGNVGIGTSDPQATLQVSGDLIVTGQIRDESGNIIIEKDNESFSTKLVDAQGTPILYVTENGKLRLTESAVSDSISMGVFQ